MSISQKFRNSLRRSFRRSRSNNGDISFLTHKKRHRYRLVEALTGQADGISFQVVGKQGMYLRCKDNILSPDKDVADPYFNKDATFVPLTGMWFKEYFAFESVSKPSYFIRLVGDEIQLDKYDGTQTFKEEASFYIKRKPCATCLKVGSQTWAKLDSGEYCLGKVYSIDSEKIDVKFNDGKKEIYHKSDASGHLVPDFVPKPSELKIGTRVLAQWSQRQTLYPGVVSAVKNGMYDVHFDDGDVSREKPFQIRLMRTYTFTDISCDNSYCQLPVSMGKKFSLSADRVTHETDYWSNDSALASSSNSAESDIGYTGNSSQHNLPIVHTPWNTVQQNVTPWIETPSEDSGYCEQNFSCRKNGVVTSDNKHPIQCSSTSHFSQPIQV